MINEYLPTFREISEMMGIRPVHAQKAIDHADHTDSFQIGRQPRCHLSMRLVTESRQPSYLLVVWSQIEGKRRFIHSAWPVPTGLVKVADPTVWDILSALCENAGLTLTQGDHEGKLLRDLRGTLSSGEGVEPIRFTTESEETLASLPFKPTLWAQIVLDVSEDRSSYEIGMAYVILGERLRDLIQYSRAN